MLLSNLGVPDEVFIKLQDDMLGQLAGKLIYSACINPKEWRTVRLRFLPKSILVRSVHGIGLVGEVIKKTTTHDT